MSAPKVQKTAQGKLLSYELPFRSNTVQTYPIESRNGSTVVLCGHQNGLKILWRGGRPFKAQTEAPEFPKKSNGIGNNAVILLDSGDEEPAKSFVERAEFADEVEEFDPWQPYPAIFQDLDLFLGTAVLNLAVLPLSIARSKDLKFLDSKIIFAAACADNSVKLITLPLTPPSPTSKARSDFRGDFTAANAGNGKWGEKIVTLNGHQKPPDGVSMTVDVSAASDPQIIVASHSTEVTGMLRLFRIDFKLSKPIINPFQTLRLATPSKSISFNPSLSKHHARLLLVVEYTGVCRIFDYSPPTKPSEDPNLQSPEQGTWLLSLYAGFQIPKPDSLHNGARAGFGRKTLVDGKWVSGGRAIVILLNDGEWAIWDVEGVAPGASRGLLSKPAIRGGSKSEYSLTGYIDAAPKSQTSGPPLIKQSKFAPMTPGTRKNADPFGARSTSAFRRGQISVVELPSASPTSPSEESILFWLGDTYALLPSLSQYWAAHASKTGGGSLFGSPAARMLKLEGIDLALRGERCSAVSQIPKTTNKTSDLVILGEHRLVILDTSKVDKKGKPISTSRFALTEKPANDDEMDLDGDLTVYGIEEALERMERGSGVKKKLGFARTTNI